MLNLKYNGRTRGLYAYSLLLIKNMYHNCFRSMTKLISRIFLQNSISSWELVIFIVIPLASSEVIEHSYYWLQWKGPPYNIDIRDTLEPTHMTNHSKFYQLMRSSSNLYCYTTCVIRSYWTLMLRLQWKGPPRTMRTFTKLTKQTYQ